MGECGLKDAQNYLSICKLNQNVRAPNGPQAAIRGLQLSAVSTKLFLFRQHCRFPKFRSYFQFAQQIRVETNLWRHIKPFTGF